MPCYAIDFPEANPSTGVTKWPLDSEQIGLCQELNRTVPGGGTNNEES
jgi:hypothetical protein